MGGLRGRVRRRLLCWGIRGEFLEGDLGVVLDFVADFLQA